MKVARDFPEVLLFAVLGIAILTTTIWVRGHPSISGCGRAFPVSYVLALFTITLLSVSAASLSLASSILTNRGKPKGELDVASSVLTLVLELELSSVSAFVFTRPTFPSTIYSWSRFLFSRLVLYVLILTLICDATTSFALLFIPSSPVINYLALSFAVTNAFLPIPAYFSLIIPCWKGHCAWSSPLSILIAAQACQIVTAVFTTAVSTPSSHLIRTVFTIAWAASVLVFFHVYSLRHLDKPEYYPPSRPASWSAYILPSSASQDFLTLSDPFAAPSPPPPAPPSPTHKRNNSKHSLNYLNTFLRPSFSDKPRRKKGKGKGRKGMELNRQPSVVDSAYGESEEGSVVVADMVLGLEEARLARLIMHTFGGGGHGGGEGLDVPYTPTSTASEATSMAPLKRPEAEEK